MLLLKLKTTIVRYKNQYNDENGHGSMVYRTVTRNNVEFYIVKVLNKNNQGNSTILYEALKWLWI